MDSSRAIDGLIAVATPLCKASRLGSQLVVYASAPWVPLSAYLPFCNLRIIVDCPGTGNVSAGGFACTAIEAGM
ncbi:MAG: hypothetical protein JXA58_04855 [Dehalococcoidia bacterium]|nr:hypothetical protein [Dehalococcoidia bacterium]